MFTLEVDGEEQSVLVNLPEKSEGAVCGGIRFKVIKSLP